MQADEMFIHDDNDDVMMLTLTDDYEEEYECTINWNVYDIDV